MSRVRKPRSPFPADLPSEKDLQTQNHAEGPEGDDMQDATWRGSKLEAERTACTVLEPAARPTPREIAA